MKLFNWISAILKEGNSQHNDSKNSHDSYLDTLERSILDMTAEEKEEMINSLAVDSFMIEGTVPISSDPLLLEAARLIVSKQQGSTALIQRTLIIGYARAGRIMDQLEELGIVSSFSGSTPREVYIKTLDALESYLKQNPSLLTKSILFYKMHRDTIEERRAELTNNQRIEEERTEKEAIKQQMLNKERKKRLHKEALNELIEAGELFNSFTNKDGRREPIPQEVMDKVWNRDGGRCVKCGSQENLEFDHIIPVSKGGATTYRNIQLLCKKCNLEKTNKIG